jgi:host factor-I protein
MIEKQTESIQERFLDNLIKNNISTALYLKSGIKLHGKITSYDQFTIILQDNMSQMIYKHAIATVVPLLATAQETFPG